MSKVAALLKRGTLSSVASPASLTKNLNASNCAFSGGSVNHFFGVLAVSVLACLPAAAQTQQAIRVELRRRELYG
jgi:hypothetical protein